MAADYVKLAFQCVLEWVLGDGGAVCIDWYAPPWD